MPGAQCQGRGGLAVDTSALILDLLVCKPSPVTGRLDHGGGTVPWCPHGHQPLWL